MQRVVSCTYQLYRKEIGEQGFYIIYQKKLVLEELRLLLWPLLLVFSSPFFILPAFLLQVVKILRLHLSWSCGSIRSEGIIISIIILIVVFFPFPPLIDVATAIFNITSFAAIFFHIIATHGRGQVYCPSRFITVALFPIIPGDLGGFHNRRWEWVIERQTDKQTEERPNTRGRSAAPTKILFLFVLLEH